MSHENLATLMLIMLFSFYVQTLTSHSRLKVHMYDQIKNIIVQFFRKLSANFNRKYQLILVENYHLILVENYHLILVEKYQLTLVENQFVEPMK
jgi:hypothetical protein